MSKEIISKFVAEQNAILAKKKDLGEKKLSEKDLHEIDITTLLELLLQGEDFHKITQGIQDIIKLGQLSWGFSFKLNALLKKAKVIEPRPLTWSQARTVQVYEGSPSENHSFRYLPIYAKPHPAFEIKTSISNCTKLCVDENNKSMVTVEEKEVLKTLLIIEKKLTNHNGEEVLAYCRSGAFANNLDILSGRIKALSNSNNKRMLKIAKGSYCTLKEYAAHEHGGKDLFARLYGSLHPAHISDELYISIEKLFEQNQQIQPEWLQDILNKKIRKKLRHEQQSVVRNYCESADFANCIDEIARHIDSMQFNPDLEESNQQSFEKLKTQTLKLCAKLNTFADSYYGGQNKFRLYDADDEPSCSLQCSLM